MKVAGGKRLRSEGATPAQYSNYMGSRHFRNRLEARQILAFLGDKSGQLKLADVGCGPAHVTRLVAKKLTDHAMIDAYDVDEEIILIASKLAERDKATNMRFIKIASDGELPAKADYDLVMSRYTLHHSADIKSHLKLLVEMLKPGGRLWIRDLYQADRLAACFIRLMRWTAPFRGEAYRRSLDAMFQSLAHCPSKEEIVHMIRSLKQCSVRLKISPVGPFWSAEIENKG